MSLMKGMVYGQCAFKTRLTTLVKAATEFVAPWTIVQERTSLTGVWNAVMS
jgi:hypothetical protein